MYIIKGKIKIKQRKINLLLFYKRTKFFFSYVSKLLKNDITDFTSPAIN